MKIAILTSSMRGTAMQVLPDLLQDSKHEIVVVIYSHSTIRNKKIFLNRKITKVFEIGVLGVVVGLIMRNWYRIDTNADKVDSLDKYCEQKKIKFISVDNWYDSNSIQALVKSKAELGISLGNGFIPTKVLNTPQFGMINIHHEILPEYQNAQSIIWQIYNGNKTTGYTIHRMSKDIDKGNILFQDRIKIDFKSSLSETVSSNYFKLIRASAKGLVSFLATFDPEHNLGIKQYEGRKYTTPSIKQFLRILINHKRLKRNESKSISK